MQEFKGTPGPWSVSFHGADNCWIVDSEKDSAIAKVTKYRADGDLQRANFNLIAAAPELLDFIIEYKSAWDDGLAGDSYLLRKAEKVIDKALGK